MKSFQAALGEWVGKKNKELFQYVRLSFQYALEDEPNLTKEQLAKQALPTANEGILFKLSTNIEFPTWCGRYLEKELSAAIPGETLGIDRLSIAVHKKEDLVITTRFFGTEFDASKPHTTTAGLSTGLLDLGGMKAGIDRVVEMFEGAMHTLYKVQVTFPIRTLARDAFGAAVDAALDSEIAKANARMLPTRAAWKL